VRLHEVNEADDVAAVVPGAARRVAVEDLLVKVDGQARPLVIVQGTECLHLVACALDRDVIVREHGTEVGAGAQVRKVDATIV
jgi:hypothetical protein